MSRLSRNVIWEYFTKCETDIGLSKAMCLECSKLLSLGSDKPGKQTFVFGRKRFTSFVYVSVSAENRITFSDPVSFSAENAFTGFGRSL